VLSVIFPVPVPISVTVSVNELTPGVTVSVPFTNVNV
jgi:hypothetical protein